MSRGYVDYYGSVRIWLAVLNVSAYRQRTRNVRRVEVIVVSPVLTTVRRAISVPAHTSCSSGMHRSGENSRVEDVITQIYQSTDTAPAEVLDSGPSRHILLFQLQLAKREQDQKRTEEGKQRRERSRRKVRDGLRWEDRLRPWNGKQQEYQCLLRSVRSSTRSGQWRRLPGAAEDD